MRWNSELDDEPKALVIERHISVVINTYLYHKGINELSNNNFCNSSSMKSQGTTVPYVLDLIKNNHFQLKLSRTAIHGQESSPERSDFFSTIPEVASRTVIVWSLDDRTIELSDEW